MFHRNALSAMQYLVGLIRPARRRHRPKRPVRLPAQTAAAAPDLPSIPDRQTEQTRPADRTGLVHWLQEALGLIPPLAALGTAGYYQTEIAHDVLGWTWWAAWIPALAIEGAAAYCAVLYDRHLVAGDSTMMLRAGMLAYAGGSSGLLWWHARDTGKPDEIAGALAFMTLSALFLWSRRGRWRRRHELRERGLIDGQAPRFSALRWLLCPVETPKAFRFGIKYGIAVAGPDAVLTHYRAWRAADRPAVWPPPQTVEQTEAGPVPDQTADARQTPRRTVTRPDRQTPQTRPSGPGQTVDLAPVRSIATAAADVDALTAIRTAQQTARRTGLPTLDQIQDALRESGQTCGRSKALRLRGLLDAANQTGLVATAP